MSILALQARQVCFYEFDTSRGKNLWYSRMLKINKKKEQITTWVKDLAADQNTKQSELLFYFSNWTFQSPVPGLTRHKEKKKESPRREPPIGADASYAPQLRDPKASWPFRLRWPLLDHRDPVRVQSRRLCARARRSHGRTYCRRCP